MTTKLLNTYKDTKNTSSLPEFTGFFASPQQVVLYEANPTMTQIEMDELILAKEIDILRMYGIEYCI